MNVQIYILYLAETNFGQAFMSEVIYDILHTGYIAPLAHNTTNEKEQQELWKLYSEYIHLFGAMILATIRGLHRYLLTNTLEILLNASLIEEYNYNHKPTEDIAFLTIFS